MAQEFFIKSENLESKVRELLPSQGGLGAGFDLSASTQIVPIVDLTESAEGSNLRADLQSSISFDTTTTFSVVNATTTVQSNTGYWRVFGIYNRLQVNSSSTDAFAINDGVTDKNILLFRGFTVTSSGQFVNQNLFDFIVKLEAGHSLKVISADANCQISGLTRQIASIDGTLVDP